MAHGRGADPKAQRAIPNRVGSASADTVDPVAMAGGAWTGFCVLLLGGLALPLVTAYTQIGPTVLSVVTGIIGFAVAGARIGAARRPAVHGMTTAAASYLLFLPIMYGFSQTQIPIVMAVTATAGITGAVAGHLRSWSLSNAANAGNEI